jgi:hypothetical protein
MSEQPLNLYGRLKAAGVPLDSHESDLYAKINEASWRIVNEAFASGELRKGQASVFLSATDGAPWYNLPFMYSPWWEARQARR